MSEIMNTLQLLFISLVLLGLLHLPAFILVIMWMLRGVVWVLNYIQPFALESWKHHLSQQK